MARSKTPCKDGPTKGTAKKVAAKTSNLQKTRSTKKRKMVSPRSEKAEVPLKDVLERNNEMGLFEDIVKLAKKAHLDPPIIFGWRKIEAFVAAAADVEAAGTGPEPPFKLPHPLTVEALKRALMLYKRAAGKPDPMGTSCLPGGVEDATRTVASLGRLTVHPWVQQVVHAGGAVNVLPIGDLFMVKPRTDKLKIALDRHPMNCGMARPVHKGAMGCIGGVDRRLGCLVSLSMNEHIPLTFA